MNADIATKILEHYLQNVKNGKIKPLGGVMIDEAIRTLIQEQKRRRDHENNPNEGHSSI
jgi:hypothetical protein